MKGRTNQSAKTLALLRVYQRIKLKQITNSCYYFNKNQKSNVNLQDANIFMSGGIDYAAAI